MSLDLTAKTFIAAELGQRDVALAAMEEEAAKRADPHDRADMYWITYLYLGMYDEALEVLSDLWYGYAAEDIGPRMDIGDTFYLVALLRNAGRDDEAAPIAERLIDIDWGTAEESAIFTELVKANYEEALRLYIERTKKGRPPFGFTGISNRFFMLKQFPEYETLDRLTNDWIEEQRALYKELTAARSAS